MKKGRRTYVVIYLLTILDILFTNLGLRKGLIEEVNPLICPLFKISIGLTSMIILVGVGALLIFLYKVRHKVVWITSVLWVVLGIKLWVLGLHINWIAKVMI